MRAGADPRQWWNRRPIGVRLALLVAGAVAVAVLALAALAWGALGESLHRQLKSELVSDAQTIAAAPDQWRASSGALPSLGGDASDGRPQRDLGPRWQILDAQGVAVGTSASRLPVTAAAREVAAARSVEAQERLTIDSDPYLMLTVPATGGGAVQVAINQDPINHTQTSFGLLLLGACAVGIAGSALLGRIVARAGLRPVQQLTQAVEDVAITMDLSRPVRAGGEDEVGRLARSVNTLLAAIDTSRRAQKTLVEDAGHELRTPLTSIRTNVELLIAVESRPQHAHRLPPEERRKLLRDLDAQVRELTTLTGELVDLAREETTLQEPEPVELVDVVGAAIGRVRTRVSGIEFSTALSPVMVDGRPAELERMLVNVLDNAAKWSPSGGVVHTELAADGPGWCRLQITDDGPGIADADRPHVFDRFYRATAARALPGSGLGLAIVAQTAEQHGGTVRTEAHPPHGTVVSIRLPRLSRFS